MGWLETNKPHTVARLLHDVKGIAVGLWFAGWRNDKYKARGAQHFHKILLLMLHGEVGVCLGQWTHNMTVYMMSQVKALHAALSTVGHSTRREAGIHALKHCMWRILRGEVGAELQAKLSPLTPHLLTRMPIPSYHPIA